jgi:hypothetical protein
VNYHDELADRLEAAAAGFNALTTWDLPCPTWYLPYLVALLREAATVIRADATA